MDERDTRLRSKLAHAGIDEPHIQAALDVDAVLQAWRRRMFKRELGHRAIDALNLDIDLAQFDVLVAVHAPVNEFGSEEGETMVSTVATRLNIDPSRASRITTDLIQRGLLQRETSKLDARRSVLTLSERGEKLMEAIRTYKFLILGSYLKDWSMDEITTFLPLLERFSLWSETAACQSQDVTDEIAQLRDQIAEI